MFNLGPSCRFFFKEKSTITLTNHARRWSLGRIGQNSTFFQETRYRGNVVFFDFLGCLLMRGRLLLNEQNHIRAKPYYKSKSIYIGAKPYILEQTHIYKS